MSLTLRNLKGSALTHTELDNNFLWLKSRDIVAANLVGNNLVLTKDNATNFSVDISSIGGGIGNRWYVPSGATVTVPSDYQSFIYGDLVVMGTVDIQDNAQLVVLNGNIYLSGGTIVGGGTTYAIDIPQYDTKVSGLTYNNNVLTLTQNNGSTFSVNILYNYTPSGSGDTNGNVGDVTWDDNYIYWKTSTQWLRTNIGNTF